MRPLATLMLLCGLFCCPVRAEPIRLILASAQLSRLNPRPTSVVLQVEMQGRFERTPVHPGDLKPRWDFPVVIDTEFLSTQPYVDFVLLDIGDGGKEKLLAGKRLKSRDLMRPGRRRLSIGRAVVTYAVIGSPKPPRISQRQRFRGKAPAGANGPALQAVFDAHADEIDACVAGKPSARGDVVLLFSISASGAPLGVVLEKASPDLSEVGACMKDKAMKWSFPPPRGSITVRYPVHFGP